MAERSSNGKRAKAPATLDLMGEGPTEPAPSRATRPPTPTESPAAEDHAALFGGGDVDGNALHPADVPVSGYPAPSQIAQIAPITERDDATEENASGPFGEDDPFADTPMARMLADEPAPLAAAMRDARAEVFADATLQETTPEQEETPMAPAPPVAQTKSLSGLTVNRRYTHPGQNVWETTEWELRTASIVGSDGTVVFEQRGVEIPKDWSQLATNVVVSKYFRGQVGTLEREYSVKQLIGRVSDKILEWGRQGSYFASEADAETFHDELRYILLHQFAAFNSPVWFNLGWAGRRQAVSACLPYDVRVNTDRGLLPIGEIVRSFQSTPDPQIWTYAPDGTPSRIIAAVCNGRKRVVNFHLADGSTLRCTSNHRVFVRDPKGDIVEKQAGDLEIGVDRLVLSREVLLPEQNHTELNSMHPDAELSWLTGLMVGDGYCGRSETLTSDTWDLKLNTPAELARAEKVLNKYGIPFRAHVKAWGWCLRGHGSVSRHFWQALGLWNRVGDKQVPEWIFRTSTENVCAFLGGLFDADGHVSQNGHRRLPVFSNTSLPLTQAVQTLLRSLGIFSALTAYSDPREDFVRQTGYTVGIYDNLSVQRFQDLIGFTHEKKQTCMAERQVDTAASWRSADVLVVSKTLGGPEYVYDIQTESATFWAEGLLLHNCYINEVNDTMESILDLYKTEGMLFKDGSGSGVNLSTLRSSKEPLAAGGKSSGPISFMKGLDASAGSIKSGGSTRRAACMRVLDVDHPDILDFILCKKDAEEKAHALIDAGYSGAFNVVGGAYDTVPFQNANHSVRVTDDFMQAVEAGAEWHTKFRHSDKTATTLKARDLMQSIAEATWVCGDPGMQYDTTINDWHTCSNTDRIYASNPCVTGDTLVATTDGWQRIDALVGGTARVIGADGQAHFVDRIFPTGHKPVFKLRTRAGYEVTVTDNHQVLTVERGDVAVKDLKLGEHLQLEGSGFGRRTLPETLAIAIGLAAGDGCLTRQTIRGREQEYIVLTMAEAETPILHEVAEELNKQKNILRAAGLCGHPGNVSVMEQSSPGAARLAVGSASVVDLFKQFAVLDEGSSRKRFTPAIYDLDKTALAAVLRGLFTADGTVANYGEKSQYVALDSTSQELLQQVQVLLLSFGIKAKIYTERRGGKLDAMLPDANRVPKSYSVQEVHSLRMTRSSRVIFEREIGFHADSMKSAKLRDMNAAFLTYADTMQDEIVSITPTGTADVYDLTEGVTNHFVANGLVVHNCSEYMFLNSTACNLSSLNLMKFRDVDGAFDVASFEHAVQIMITAQEIVVGFAAYPTEKIEERSHVYRTLGLGYANLGALLMAEGLPYDSDAGRAYAGAVTAIMTGRAYHQSAVIARDCGGPFAGYQENREPMLRVMQKHREHVEYINKNLIPESLLTAARDAWDEVLSEGQKNGFRNAQATVLAPTGTIGFLMDCDTTGIEPDIAIVKYKSLVGGGMMKIVNQTVPEALRRLGYTADEGEAIIKFIDEHDTIEGAPGLKPEHLPIFDCAFRPMNGTRSIHHMGHIQMMAAAQPFISGAISKTVNMPNDSTPMEIADAYTQAWKLGIKAVAIYRDGSKRTQPLNTSKETPAGEKAPAALAAPEGAAPQAVRRRLPDERASITHKFSIGGHEGYLTVGLYPDTQQPGEIFIRMAKEGSSISGLMDSFATAISLALQYGVPLSTLVDKFIHSRFEPSGFTGNKDIPMAKSVMDYIFRYLALRFLQREERQNVGLLADQEGYGDAAPASPAPKPLPLFASAPTHDAKNGSLSNGNGTGNGHTNGNGQKSASADNAHLADTKTATLMDHEREIYRMQSDAPPCPECGAITIRSGACYKCISCGTSLGCS